MQEETGTRQRTQTLRGVVERERERERIFSPIRAEDEEGERKDRWKERERMSTGWMNKKQNYLRTRFVVLSGLVAGGQPRAWQHCHRLHKCKSQRKPWRCLKRHIKGPIHLKTSYL